jgi:hypothetical protein
MLNRRIKNLQRSDFDEIYDSRVLNAGFAYGTFRIPLNSSKSAGADGATLQISGKTGWLSPP